MKLPAAANRPDLVEMCPNAAKRELCPSRSGRAPQLLDAGHECVLLAEGPQSWPAVLSELSRRRLGIVLVEGGAAVAASLLAAGGADRLHLFVAPAAVGGDGARLDALGRRLGELAAAAEGASVELYGAEWTLLANRSVGGDREIILRK